MHSDWQRPAWQRRRERRRRRSARGAARAFQVFQAKLFIITKKITFIIIWHINFSPLPFRCVWALCPVFFLIEFFLFTQNCIWLKSTLYALLPVKQKTHGSFQRDEWHLDFFFRIGGKRAGGHLRGTIFSWRSLSHNGSEVPQRATGSTNGCCAAKMS